MYYNGFLGDNEATLRAYIGAIGNILGLYRENGLCGKRGVGFRGGCQGYCRIVSSTVHLWSLA